MVESHQECSRYHVTVHTPRGELDGFLQPASADEAWHRRLGSVWAETGTYNIREQTALTNA